MGLMSVAWGRLMSRNPAQTITPFLMIQPIFAVIGGYFINGETLNMSVFAGGLVVLLGIGIINWRALAKRRTPPEISISN
jgi:O-acetylserine/cysteine efflux transporter